jgi:hypothetical protein
MPKPSRRIKNFAGLVAAAVPAHARDKPLELWRQDEARAGQQGTLSRVRAERGSRPRAPRDQRYDWAYIFGAVCPARDTGAALVLPYANTGAMNLHLAEISLRVSPEVMPLWCSTAPAGTRPAAICAFPEISACCICRHIPRS